eukprot:gene6396-biopygen4067
MAKASNQSLSPLLALIGQYLLFFNDSEDGRRRLVEILFLQDADQRLKIHNWYMLCTAGHRKAVKEGHKVDRLQVPMFPWSDHVLRELNTKMLDAVASVGSLEGGEYPLTEAERLKKMFAREESVLRIGAPGGLEGGADPLPVRDANGQPVNFYVDVQEIENACNAICEAYKKNDDRLYSYIQKLEAKVDDLKKRPAQQKVQHIHHYEAPYDEYGEPRRGRGGQRWRGGRGGTYRGGSSNMDEEYPKNA